MKAKFHVCKSPEDFDSHSDMFIAFDATSEGLSEMFSAVFESKKNTKNARLARLVEMHKADLRFRGQEITESDEAIRAKYDPSGSEKRAIKDQILLEIRQARQARGEEADWSDGIGSDTDSDSDSDSENASVLYKPFETPPTHFGGYPVPPSMTDLNHGWVAL